jgi:hypothetical protein
MKYIWVTMQDSQSLGVKKSGKIFGFVEWNGTEFAGNQSDLLHTSFCHDRTSAFPKHARSKNLERF